MTCWSWAQALPELRRRWPPHAPARASSSATSSREFGGSLLNEAADAAARIEGHTGQAWLAASLAQLAAQPHVTLLPRTTAFGYFPHNLVGLSERLTEHLPHPPADLPRERQWQVRAREVVLAAGAIERPLVFPGNDRPGIMLAGAAASWLHRYGVLPGTRAVLVTATMRPTRPRSTLQRAGVFVATIADVRAGESAAAAHARAAGIPVMTGATVLGTSGRRRVSALRLAQLQDGSVVNTQTQPCDVVLMAGGFTPSVHLYSQSRGKLEWDENLQAFLPAAPAERVRCAGACRGVFALAAVLDDGAAAGEAAARDALARTHRRVAGRRRAA